MRPILPILALGIWLVAGSLPTAADYAVGRSTDTAAAAQNQPSTSPAAMTNEDVVKMVKAGLSEDIVIAAIQAAKERQFTLTTEGLIQLKTNGVPDRVVAAMLNPSAAGGTGGAGSAGTGTAAPPPTPSLGGGPTTAPLPVAEVSLVSSSGTQAIMPEGGDISTTFAVIRTIVWANFRGLKSDARTTDRRPSILVRTDETKFDTRFIVVKADVDDDDNVRSVRLRSGVYSMSTAFQPDSSWIIATVAAQEQPGTWRMTIHRDLDRGEYGVMDTQNRYLYGFAVDR